MWLVNSLFPRFPSTLTDEGWFGSGTAGGKVVPGEDLPLDSRPYVYLTAVGGKMMAGYIAPFIARFRELGLKGLIIALLDEYAIEACDNVPDQDASVFLCLDSQVGHVIYNKHRWIPILLSAHVDVLWLDFDIYLFKDPITHIRENYACSKTDSKTGDVTRVFDPLNNKEHAER